MIVGERGAANEQWLFQCDDRRRRPLKTALYRRIEDKRRRLEDKGVRRVTLHDATLTISNDQSPYFHSSPFPLPVAVPGACRLARIPAMGAQARMEQRKCENADDTKQIADDTKQIEDDTKQHKRRQSSWDPNSVGLGLGYFERFDFVKPLTHEKHCIQISKHVINHGKIMHMEKKEDKWRKPRSVKDCG
ncbi:hypothetical protein T08_4398 [Trichinella sp. T8]|nr:hypothetical protein T08_4398 [Trichinella sp. T8]